MKKLLAFLRLSRPIFLAGGALVYALGAAMARSVGVPIRGEVYLLGQLGVTAVQLMTHYLNEYWDFEADLLNRNRTPWSGGSGVLPLGLLAPRTALTAAWVCAGVAVLVLAALLIGVKVGWETFVIFGLAFSGAYFYSSPPVRLAQTGLGEWTTAGILAGLVPSFSYTLQAGGWSAAMLPALIPLALLGVAMILTYEFPDFLTDEAAGKRTLLVRLGQRAGRQLHAALLLAAYLALTVGVWFGSPGRAALGAFIPLPLALLQTWQLRRISQGVQVPWSRLTFAATANYALTAYFLVLGFWTAV